MIVKLNKINTISNYISFSRILLGIIIFFLLDKIQEDYSYRIILFALMWLGFFSDLLDGYLARKLNQVSELGKIIDPLADKICIAIIVIKLYLIGEINAFYFWTIVLRDVMIFFGGILLTRKIKVVLPSNYLGKITVLFIGLFLGAVVMNLNEIDWLYNSLYYISLILSFLSVVGYGLRAIETLNWNKNRDVQEYI
ncbi:MAG: CDP-alcohol phosphatidyltransferase family protein [Ignavibacteriales bacterium]|nr:CDP-alcohol phosphatidyltransferase family protein [Ignavibacteriales bacterium]